MEPLGHTGMRCLLFCCLLLLLAARLSEGKRDGNNNNNNNRAARPKQQARAERCKNKRTWLARASDLEKTPLILKCAHGPVVSAHVTGIKGKCKGTTGFTRWIAERCTWNQTCNLGFRNRVIDNLVPPVTDNACLGQVPDKLEVGYTCLKKKVTVTDTLGTFKKTKRQAGIVRSHALLPWSYRNGVGLGNVTFVRPRKPQGATNLWISVYLYAILNSDLLFLSWDESVSNAPPGGAVNIRAMRQVLPNDTTFTLSDVTKVILTFYADYTHHRSELEGEEKGFLLCYQWLKPDAKPKKGSACSKVLMPAKCKGKRGGRKKNRRGRNRGSRANNPRSRKQGSRKGQGSGGGNNNNNNNQRPRKKQRRNRNVQQ